MQRTLVVGLYCRVSTDEQAQQGFSIESQKERLEAFCRSQGWLNYRYYIDDGYSGTSLVRPALAALVEDINQHKIATVLVYRLDRLGRKQKDVLHLLEDVFEPHHVIFRSATEPFDTSTSFGKAMLGMLAVFAQLERDTIIERTTMGRRQRAKDGLWPGGRVPYGYRWEKAAQRLHPAPEEAAIVKEVYKQFLCGESLAGISRWIKARSTSRSWTHSMIREILTRPVYIGSIQSDGELVKGRHEAIIDHTTWQMAQAELAKRRAGHPPVGAHLLSGLLYCGVCGGKVVHIPYKSKHRGRFYSYEYYGCQGQHKRTKGTSLHCNLGFKRKEPLEKQILEEVFRLRFDSQLVQMETQALTTAGQRREEIVEPLNVSLQTVEAKLKRWYLTFEEGIISPHQLAEHIGALEVEKAALALRLHEETAAAAHAKTDLPEFPPDLVRAAWPTLSFKERQAVLRLAIRKITLLKEEPGFRIEWNITAQ